MVQGTKPLRILAIDDDAPILKMISRMLIEEGYDVLVASNGQEGMQIIKSTSKSIL